MVSLLVMSKRGVFTLPLAPAAELTVGRATSCDIHVDDGKMSRCHAVIRAQAGRIEVEDLGSLNGTLLGERRLEAKRPTEMRVGEMVTIGATVIVLQGAGAQPPRRVWSKEQLDALTSACVSPYALVAVHVEPKALSEDNRSTVDANMAADVARVELLERIILGPLRSTDVLAAYTRGRYDVFLEDTLAPEARRIAAAIESALRDARLEARVALECHPPDDETPKSGEIERGAMSRLEPFIEKVAGSTISVLILGETGVGKEVMARTIHSRSARAKAPLVCINCAALSESLLESELFGHERGAFTGAVQAKPGLLEAASGGTFFLDEIGEMRLALQAKLLRVLEQREVQRLGSLAPRPIDVRFIAATNRDLEEEIEARRFREDLYFRLNGISLTIPPLRERLEEIEPLARAFLARACERAGRAVPAISTAALELLRRYRWPGNVRELRNLMERALVLCGDVILVEHFPAECVVQEPEPPRDDPFQGMNVRERVIAALEACNGNQTRAAEMLGVSRRTLITRMEQYDLPRPRKR
jgi:DNA-binding NtrC family response regulator